MCWVAPVPKFDQATPDARLQRRALDALMENRERAGTLGEAGRRSALARFAQRLNEFVERERNFTRDASHELRSPLTVIRMAASIILEDPQVSEATRRTATRIQRACQNMRASFPALREPDHRAKQRCAGSCRRRLAQADGAYIGKTDLAV